MKIKTNKILAFLCSLLLCAAVPPPLARAAQPPEVLGEAAVLMDCTTGKVLYEKNSRERLYPASITKLMTGLLTAENTQMTDVVTFSHEAVYGIEPGSSHIAVQEGEQLTVEQCLYGLFLQSANEVAAGLAEHISGTQAAFAQKMTARAKELGCTDTNFVNPHGLHNDDHYTTAYDMALIAREVQTHDELMTIMGTVSYEIPPTNVQTETRYIHAQNQMIKPPSIYAYDYCLGGKNGFTNEALNTLVTFAEKDGVRLLCVVLKENGANAYVDSINLFDYGFANYQTATVFQGSEFSLTLPVQQTYEGKTVSVGEVQLVTNGDLKLTYPKDAGSVTLERQVNCPEVLEAPLSADTAVGTLDLYQNKELVGSLSLYPATDVAGYTPEELTVLMRPAALTAAIQVGKIALKVLIVVGIAAAVFVLILYLDHRTRKKKYEESYRRRYKARYGVEPESIPQPRRRKRSKK